MVHLLRLEKSFGHGPDGLNLDGRAARRQNPALLGPFVTIFVPDLSLIGHFQNVADRELGEVWGSGHAIPRDVTVPKVSRASDPLGAHHSLDVAGPQDAAVPF